MQLRFYIVGLVWLAIMVLLFVTPIPQDHMTFFNFLPARVLIHFGLFWGLTHIWLGAFKKQMNFEKVRKKAIPIAVTLSIIVLLASEIYFHISGAAMYLGVTNILFSLLGIGFGIFSFRLLYRNCY